MTAQECIKEIMTTSRTSLGELVEYAEMKSKSNLSQMLSREDMKVSTFVKLLDTMGYELIVVNTENSDEEYLID